MGGSSPRVNKGFDIIQELAIKIRLIERSFMGWRVFVRRRKRPDGCRQYGLSPENGRKWARLVNGVEKFRKQGGIAQLHGEDGTLTQMVFNGMEEKTAIWIT
jgi:hypothetical protein